MSGVNRVTLLGRVGNDPELAYTQGGTAALKLSIATGRRVKDRESGEWKEVTSWHRIKAFGKQAEILKEHLRKGDLLYLEGRLDYWDAKGDKGGTLQVAEVILEHFEFCGGRREGGEQRAPRSGPAPRGTPRAADPGPTTAAQRGGAFDDLPFDDDIPF